MKHAQPGVLTWDPAVSALETISPSRYQGILACALREVWAAAKKPNLLPTTPAARLGGVIHQLLEDAGLGRLNVDDQKPIEGRWEYLVKLAEKEMAANWLERHLVPLEAHIFDFEVRRIRAWKRALEILAVEHVAESQIPYGKQRFGNEMYVHSTDGRIVGRIDRVLRQDDGPVIIDYKSGSVTDDDSDIKLANVKTDYVQQMHLYAALYASSTGEWPVALQIIPLSGLSIKIDFNRAECEHLLDGTLKTLSEINAVIASSTGAQTIDQLARPSPNNCRFCAYRPGCEPYRRAHRKRVVEGRKWPMDLSGVLTDIRPLGNLTISIEMEDEEAPHTKYYVRGLDTKETRHPAMSISRIGDQISIFNLSGSDEGKTSSESKLTTIYRKTTDNTSG